MRHSAPHTFSTKGEGEAWLVTKQHLITSGGWRAARDGQEGPPMETAFGVYAERWLADRKLKPRSREGYQQLLTRYLKPTFAAVPLDAITSRMVRAWWAGLASNSPTANARAYALLKAIMNTAVADEVITGNPCRIRSASNPSRAREIRPATLAELDTIVAAMPVDRRALVLLSAWCALRQGEVLELRRRDVDLGRGALRIERAVSWVGGRPIVGTPKSAAGTRSVAIPPHIVGEVKTHLDDYVGEGPESLLFPARGGIAHLQPSTLHRSWREARAVAGRPDLRLHDLRHTGATMAAMAGATLAELQERLGHSSVAAALRYQHAAKGRDQEIARALSRMALGSAGGSRDNEA